MADLRRNQAILIFNILRTKFYLPKRKGYAANDLDLDNSTNIQPLSIIQNPSALVAKPYGKRVDQNYVLVAMANTLCRAPL